MILINHRAALYQIKKHDRIAQFTIEKAHIASIVDLTDGKEETQPEPNSIRTGGFGSTGQ